jgi:hypothetical protein
MGPWTQRRDVSGIHVHAAFFDGESLGRETNMVRRTLGFFPGIQAKLLFTESERRNFRMNGVLVAQPDAVYRLGSGHINLEYKSRSGRPVSESEWVYEVRLEDMLQCIFTGIVLAQVVSTPVANVLRYPNAAFFLVPDNAVIREAWRMLPLALSYFGGSDIACKPFARFVSERIRIRFGQPFDPRSARGRKAHEEMLRPD